MSRTDSLLGMHVVPEIASEVERCEADEPGEWGDVGDALDRDAICEVDYSEAPRSFNSSYPSPDYP